jgi:hypothetical protein
MTKATDLSEALAACLGQISPGNGYASDIKAVYGFGEVKKDTAPLPCLLVTVTEDQAAERVGSRVKRTASYEVQGIFSRSASLQDLQRCHHDILLSLGYGDLPPGRELLQGEIVEEAAEFDPGIGGSNTRAVISRLVIRYIETY